MTRLSRQPGSDESRVELLERAGLLDDLAAALADAADGRGRMILLGAEAGAGKTALLREFCGRDPGARVLWGACERLFTPRALGPFLDVAQSAEMDLEGFAPNRRVPHEFLDALVAELRRESPTVLVVEDVHWADEGTLDVVKLLARRIQALPALALVSFRDDQLIPTSPLQIVLGELAGTRAADRRQIPGLSLDAVRTLAEPTGVDAYELFEKTGGNPFFVTEALAATGMDVPETVRDAVLARTAQLEPAARRLLEAAAVVPARTELWLLEAVGGEDFAQLEACLGSGMLVHEDGAVAFRHELARLAVEDAITPDWRVGLHRRVLVALTTSGHGPMDPARLAHHADAAGDVEAVLRYAPAAGERAAGLCVHREAADQFARALRHAAALTPERRAELWQRRSYESYLSQQFDAAVQARRAALALHQELGDRLREGDDRRWLSRLAWFGADRATAVREGRRAVELLETEPPGRELAMAYSNMSQLSMLAGDVGEALECGELAIELAERLGETEILVHALNNVGSAEVSGRLPGGVAKLERSLALAQEAGFEEHVARAFTNLAAGYVWARVHERADHHLSHGIGYCIDHDLDPWRIYMTGWMAQLRLEEGRWDEAAEHATAVLREPNVPAASRIMPLAVLGRLRARRGDPHPWEPLDEALELARRSDELQRLAPVATARAEAHWLDGSVAVVAAETGHTLALALELDDPWAVGELCAWRRRAGTDDSIDPGAVAAPFALELSGDPAAAADCWDQLGCPYEAALARADTGAEDALREALVVFQRLGAVPATRAVTQRLRSAGVRSIARGPRRSTINNPGQLTSRQVEILRLLADGLTNAEIAARLYITPKTVAHHVSAVLGKLGVRSRRQAAAEAARLGVLTK
ncbi:MAG TPA: AAA family ATPase [Solirubrobacteraceae bacterium]|nr:AAA family ATPase [Solirubrobacteraceae bacterium]